jgi:hypothetical protein
MRKRDALLLICLCLGGCSAERVETTLDGVNVSIDDPTGPVDVVDDAAQIQVATGKYALAIKNGQLTVNGKEYGPVTEGDDVLISSGEITINGRPAKATEN